MSILNLKNSKVFEKKTVVSIPITTGFLTHLSRMYTPTLISRTSLLPILGVLGVFFHFFEIRVEHSLTKY